MRIPSAANAVKVGLLFEKKNSIGRVLTQFLLALVGHFSKECPQGGGGGVCYNCGLVLLPSGIILINSNNQ